MNFEQQGVEVPEQEQNHDDQYDEFGDIDGENGFAQGIQNQLPPVVNHGQIQGANLNAPNDNLYNQKQQV